jgi:hypothetical protein
MIRHAFIAFILTSNHQCIPVVSMTTSTNRLSLLVSLLIITPCDAQYSFHDFWAQWGSLLRYLVALFFAILGLHLVLYAHMATYSLMKTYMKHGKRIKGDVLDCTPIDKSRNQITVLYDAVVPKYEDPRLQFRHPDAAGTVKRFMRRFDTCLLYQRGSVIDIVLLPGLPKSGLLLEVVEMIQTQHSHLKTVLLLVPGSCLICFTLFMAVATIQENFDEEHQRHGYIVLVAFTAVISLLSRIIVGGRWEQVKNRRFLSAVATKTATASNRKEDPLLPLVVVQGYDVLVMEGVVA